MALMASMKSFFEVGTQRKFDGSGRLNLLAVAEVHVLWKARLGHHVRGSECEMLDRNQVGQGGVCQLGNWIEGSELQPYRDFPEFRDLSRAHWEFHQAGGRVIRHLEAGERDQAELVFNGQYSAALRTMIRSLTELNAKLEQITPDQ